MTVRLRRAAACALATCFAGATAAPAAELADGQAAFDSGRFADALAIWRPLAAQGDPKAALGMGVLYDLGDAVPQDTAAAFHWYRKAADAGLADAELNVAVMYDSGRGVARDGAAAALWYARAAAHHDHRAEYDLAQLYEAGDGVPRNRAVAAAWLRAAAAGGVDAAGERLAVAHAAHQSEVTPGAALAPAAPAAPLEGAVLDRFSVARSTELVWTAPPEPTRVRFYFEMLAVAPAGPERVFSGFTDTSSVLVPLQPAFSQYIWRVYVVGAAQRAYLPSAWTRFGVIWRGSLGAG